MLKRHKTIGRVQPKIFTNLQLILLTKLFVLLNVAKKISLRISFLSLNLIFIFENMKLFENRNYELGQTKLHFNILICLNISKKKK